jgi:aldose 1-epimerase
VISLRNGGAVLDLLPEIGGAVSRFGVDGVDVLRPAAAGAQDVLQTAYFPLVPFANRVANGTFDFAGETIRLPRNFGDHPHALHGEGWQSPWRVETQGATTAQIRFDHAAGAWPWRYAATQTFDLAPQSLRIALAIQNCDPRAMPVSLGFHPYFPRLPRTRLRTDVRGVWLSDETGIPTGRAEAAHFLDLGRGAPLASAPFVDHCHFGWSGEASIEQPDQEREVRLSASPQLDFLHLFVPQSADYFCAEPVSAMPDAVHRPAAIGGMQVLQSGDSFSAVLTISARRSRYQALLIGHP